MSRYDFYIDKDFKGVKAADKRAIVDSLAKSHKTSTQLSAELDLDPIYVRKALTVLLDIGYVQKCGRDGKPFIWGLKG